jgi:hypothetical protein
VIREGEGGEEAGGVASVFGLMSVRRGKEDLYEKTSGHLTNKYKWRPLVVLETCM